MAGEAELAFVATMRDEASAAAKQARRNLDAVGGKTKPVETELRVRDEASRVLDAVGARLQTAGRRMQSVGRGMTKGITLPIIGAGIAIGRTSLQFSRGMGDVASLLPGNTKRVSELRAEVLRLGPEVGASLTDVSQGLYQTLSAFGDTADTAKILEINARSARAGAASVGDAVNLTSAVTKAYGDTSAKAVGKVSDLALQTVKLGQTTFPELAASIGRVTPLTSELGVSTEELFATMATFTGVTGPAAEVSTQLRGALQALMAPTADAAAAIKGAGYESGKALVQQRGLAGSIEFLTAQADKSGKPLASYIGSIEGQTIALGLAGAQGDEYRRKLGEMGKAQGVTGRAFEAATSGAGEQAFTFDQAKAKAEALAVVLADGAAPALRDMLTAARPVVDKIVGLAQAFSDASPRTQGLIVKSLALAAALGPTLIIAGKLTTATGTLIRGYVSLRTAILGSTVATNADTVAKNANAAATGRGAARLARFGGAARVAAGAAGLALLTVETDTATGSILKMMGAGALFGTTFGPVGTAVGGLAGAIAGMTMDMRKNGEEVAAQKEVQRSYRDTLDQTTGAITRQTRAAVLDELQKRS